MRGKNEFQTGHSRTMTLRLKKYCTIEIFSIYGESREILGGTEPKTLMGRGQGFKKIC
jgi:hypothetical protein